MSKGTVGKASFSKGAAAKAVRVSGGLPGSSSRARINEAAGSKVKTSADAGKPGTSIAQAKAAESYVMPIDHPSSQTTRKVKSTDTFG